MIQELSKVYDGVKYNVIVYGPSVSTIDRIVMINDVTRKYHAIANIDHNAEHINIHFVEDGVETSVNYNEFSNIYNLMDWMGLVVID